MHNVCLILLCFTPLAVTKIEESYIDKDERHVVVVSSAFGFTELGIMDVLVSKFQDYKPSGAATPDLTKMGFLLAPSESETQLDMDLLQGNCPLSDNPSYVSLFNLKQVRMRTRFGHSNTITQVRDTQTIDEAQHSGDASFIQQYPITSVLPDFMGGELSLYFVKCPGLEPYVVTIDIKVASYNLKGERKDYLSVGDDALPLLYMVRCYVY